MKRRNLLKTFSLSALVGGMSSWVSNLAHAQDKTSVTASATAGPELPQKIQRIAFGSCIDQNKPQPIWRAILATKPDLFIFGGDNVYASRPPWHLDQLQKAYATQAAQEGFAQLRREVPHMAIWDDHDMGQNDGGAGFAHKQVAKDAFMAFWELPANDTRRQREGLYQAFQIGPLGQRVQIILLDTRWFKSEPKVTDDRNAPGKERYVPDTDPKKTMLGAAQWQWLEMQLKQAADVRLIVSGIQVVADGHGWESWGNFPHELEKMRQLVQKTQAKGVIFLSGDRHIGAVYKSKTNTNYPLYELTSSGMTHAWANANEAGPNRLGQLVTQNHFALIDFNWPQKQIQLGFQNTQGEWLKRQSIDLSELQ
jgi:alkaline phosphatase D